MTDADRVHRVDSPSGPATARLVTLDGLTPAGQRLSTLGGKGSALDALVAGGLPVPTTSVLTTVAYRRMTAEPGVQALLDALNGSDDTPHSISDADVDTVFIAAARGPMREQVRAWAIEAHGRVAPTGPVAVRSSATTEDLAGASFAGQYESFLDVTSEDELVDAIARVWASLWHHAPRLYRRLHRIADDDVAMAVLIQAMVPALSAGVVFTEDPGGARGCVRVERVVGLGDALVSGDVTPTVHLVRRTDIDARALIPEAPHDVVRAATLATRCEELFECSQDVEWARDETEVWVVQSRPITVAGAPTEFDGFDSVVSDHRRYTTAGVGEMLPGVLTPLVWATAGFMVEEAYRHVMARLGALPATITDDTGFVVRVRGRAALDLDDMNEAAKSLPGGSAQEVEQQFFGTAVPHDDNDDVEHETPASVRARVRHDLRVLRTNRTARKEQAITEAAITALLARPMDVACLTDREIMALRSRLVDLGARATTAEFSIAAAAVAAYRRIEVLLHKHFGTEEGSRWAMLVTSRLHRGTVMWRAQDLAARLLDAGDEGSEALGSTTWEDARSRLSASGRPDLVSMVRATADLAGCQRIVAGSTWTDDPEAFWRLVRGAHEWATREGQRDDAEFHLAQLERALVDRPGWRRTRILTGQIVDVRRQLVRRLAFDATNLLERRERAKALLLGLGGRLRTVDLELGSRLAARQLLLHPSDIDYLHPAEIRDGIENGRLVSPDVVLGRRRCVERWRSEEDLPLAFTGQPTPVRPPAPTGLRLDGWAASPGRHTGPVRFLRAPDDGAVNAGDVVVARRTDAAWSPVFLRAGAIVVEEGGPLSHAAIVAREFGLPAVVNVPGAATRLRHERGAVTVDGDNGLVFIPQTSDAAAASSGSMEEDS